MHALTALPDVSPSDRLGVTTFFAVLAHLIFILGVTFVPEDRVERRVTTLDVVLVPRSSETPPDRADYLARANQEGSGDSVEKMRPGTPPPAAAMAREAPMAAAIPGAPAPAPPAVEPRAEDSARSPASARTAVSIVKETPTAEPQRATAAAVPAAPPAPGHDVDAVPPSTRSAAIAALSAQIERKLRAYAERPRRKWVSARTREHAFAAYMDGWRRKVERVGNLHYPDEAARQGLSGSLLLEVALNPNGTVEEIALRRSSGEPVLDDAAVRIVKLAAPFARFPESIAGEVDVLHIQRTWIFHSGNRFSSP